MNRAARLLTLIETLRRHRRPVRGRDLATEAGVSLRTLYRDIAALQGQGVPVEGEAGLGYILRAGLTVPPLMFDEGELDALVLGLRFVERRFGGSMAEKAAGALAKIEAVLPAGRSAQDVHLYVGLPASGEASCLAAIRAAIRSEGVIELSYRDKAGAATQRAVWPVIVGVFEAAEVLAAWCELRGDFRHFRLDRIASITETGRRFGRSHRLLLAEWQLYRCDHDGG